MVSLSATASPLTWCHSLSTALKQPWHRGFRTVAVSHANAPRCFIRNGQRGARRRLCLGPPVLSGPSSRAESGLAPHRPLPGPVPEGATQDEVSPSSFERTASHGRVTLATSTGFAQHRDLAQNTHKTARVRPTAWRVWLRLPGVSFPVVPARRVLGRPWESRCLRRGAEE